MEYCVNLCFWIKLSNFRFSGIHGPAGSVRFEIVLVQSGTLIPGLYVGDGCLRVTIFIGTILENMTLWYIEKIFRQTQKWVV